jgi:hypothetical protein
MVSGNGPSVKGIANVPDSHDRISAVTPREVTAWRDRLAAAGQTDRDGRAAAMAPAGAEGTTPAVHRHARPLRDRAIAHLMGVPVVLGSPKPSTNQVWNRPT